jgi:hypothetical protein
MATTAHIGESRALIFPVMCDGHLKIEYDDYNTNDSKHKLWDCGGPFSIEAILTPYDVNGVGHRDSGQGRLDSTKTPPSPNLSLDDHADTTSNYESVSYFGAGRNTHKMMIFCNDYLKFYLQNTTSSNFNQPAEYKIVVELTDSLSTPITHTVASEPVFISQKNLVGYYDPEGLYNGISTDKTNVTTSASGSGNNITVGSGEADDIGAGNQIYNNSGVLIGTVASVSGNTITLSDTPATAVTSTIYRDQQREALYLEQTNKVGVSFDSNTITLYLNNQPVKRVKVNIGKFRLDTSPGDCFIGQDGNNPNRKATQFMGELYEIAFHKSSTPCASISTLTPSYNDILFYYSFGD